MLKGSRGSTGLAVVALLFAVGLAVANLILFAAGGTELPPDLAGALSARYASAPAATLYFGAAPLLLGLLALLASRTPAVSSETPAAPKAESAAAAPAGPPPETAALRLLALLQQEARFADFIQENIDGYDDAQVGAAARTIHSGCRKALAGRIELERILADEEGSDVTVADGFDPAAIRLTGNVAGQPPFQGTLQHAGWRAVRVQLPESHGQLDATVIAPAEVEIA